MLLEQLRVDLPASQSHVRRYVGYSRRLHYMSQKMAIKYITHQMQRYVRR